MTEWIKPSQFYTNRSAIRPPAVQGVDNQIRPAYFFSVGQRPILGLPHKNLIDHIETL